MQANMVNKEDDSVVVGALVCSDRGPGFHSHRR